ncbi:MAG: PD-(D/E)XK nuclease family transposase [Leptospiraceae bacterium]|nr:PD-(D/E)XK nuclease family transposase [Leptospiraceae bacterium]
MLSNYNESKVYKSLSDFDLRSLFGEEGSKDFSKFLNELLPPKHKIQNLSLKPTERLPAISTERKVIFDIHCISESEVDF